MCAMDERERRLGLNEAMFRQVNEAVSDISGDLGVPGFEIVCECDDLNCTERIHVTRAAYSALRSESRLFAVVPGHETTNVETVVADEVTYHVVRKDEPEARAVAERTDPNA
jgi:hypothetical protein